MIVGKDYALHYFLRPDHREVSDIWLAGQRYTAHERSGEIGRNSLFLHLEGLHDNGAMTTCAFNRHTGGLAGFVTVDPANSRLEQISVARTARGSGVATMLLNEAKRLCPDRIEIEIAEDNARAIRFCEREGFRKTGLAAPERTGVRMWALRWRPDETI